MLDKGLKSIDFNTLQPTRKPFGSSVSCERGERSMLSSAEHSVMKLPVMEVTLDSGLKSTDLRFVQYDRKPPDRVVTLHNPSKLTVDSDVQPPRRLSMTRDVRLGSWVVSRVTRFLHP